VIFSVTVRPRGRPLILIYRRNTDPCGLVHGVLGAGTPWLVARGPAWRMNIPGTSWTLLPQLSDARL